MNDLVRFVLIALLLGSASVARAQGGPPPGAGGGAQILGSDGHIAPPSFLNQLFPPKVVMEHQQEIGLRPAQADAIKQAMRETQTKLLDLQWHLDAESEALDKLVAGDHVDEKAVLAKLDQVTSIEQQVKRENFALLVRIKNLLDPDQQTKLRAIRPARGFGPPGPPPPPPPRD